LWKNPQTIAVLSVPTNRTDPDMKLFKAAAVARGYDFWYDRSLKMWSLTKEGVEAEYFDAYILNQMGLAKFVQVYLRKD
jgi:hypothetical protein